MGQTDPAEHDDVEDAIGVRRRRAEAVPDDDEAEGDGTRRRVARGAIVPRQDPHDDPVSTAASPSVVETARLTRASEGT